MNRAVLVSVTGMLLVGCGSGSGLTGAVGASGHGGGGIGGAQNMAGAKGTGGVAGRGGAAGGFAGNAVGSAGAAGGAAGGGGGDGGTPGGAAGAGDPAGTAGTVQLNVLSNISPRVDLLFMIDNSSGMTSMQQKLAAQIPSFIQALQQFPNGLPNLHIAVASSDMGAPGDQTTAIGCTPQGDNGKFQVHPPAGTTCSTTLALGATFISDGGGQANFTAPLPDVLQCMLQLGASGCGFEHQLASTARALGADGNYPPDGNGNFVRDDAVLAIVLLTNEDDCSAPANTPLFSLNGGKQSITNALGPIANYRCNQFGHICRDPDGNLAAPPLTPPASAQGNPPVLNLTACTSNESNGPDDLTPVGAFVSGIMKLKPDPANQIVVAAITGPADPYAVEWLPPASPPPGTAGELWPQVMHVCGPPGGGLNPQATMLTTDGSSADPGVRIAQFTTAFPNSVLASICDPNYHSAMLAIGNKLAAMTKPFCVPLGPVQNDAQGTPACTVTNHLQDSAGKDTDVPVASCAATGGTPPCWTLVPGAPCAAGSYIFKLLPDPAVKDKTSISATVNCTLCQPGSTMPGC